MTFTLLFSLPFTHTNTHTRNSLHLFHANALTLSSLSLSLSLSLSPLSHTQYTTSQHCIRFSLREHVKVFPTIQLFRKRLGNSTLPIVSQQYTHTHIHTHTCTVPFSILESCIWTPYWHHNQVHVSLLAMHCMRVVIAPRWHLVYTSGQVNDKINV